MSEYSPENRILAEAESSLGKCRSIEELFIFLDRFLQLHPDVNTRGIGEAAYSRGHYLYVKELERERTWTPAALEERERQIDQYKIFLKKIEELTK